MGTEEGMGKDQRPLWEATTCCRFKSSDLIYLDANPGTRAQGTAALGPGPRAFFFWVGFHFFQGLDEVDFFDESLSSLSRLR